MVTSLHESDTLGPALHYTQRALEKGNVGLASRYIRRLTNTPRNERVDILRATTAVLTGDPVPVEAAKGKEIEKTIDDYANHSPEFTDEVLRLVAASMIGLRERDDTLVGIVGFKRRNEQYTHGARYLVDNVEGLDVDTLLPEDGSETIPLRQIEELEDYLGKPRKDRDRRSRFNPLSH